MRRSCDGVEVCRRGLRRHGVAVQKERVAEMAGCGDGVTENESDKTTRHSGLNVKNT